MRGLLLAVLFLSGCASTTEVTTRTVTDTPPPPAETLLLVAQSPEGDTRETWELTCRPIFERAGLTVLLSHQEVPLWYERGRKATGGCSWPSITRIGCRQSPSRRR